MVFVWEPEGHGKQEEVTGAPQPKKKQRRREKNWHKRGTGEEKDS